MRVPTCNKQRVHAWRRLGGLEHFADVLFGKWGLPSALPLGVLLLPPLEVLLEGSQREESGVRGGSGGHRGGKQKAGGKNKKIENENCGKVKAGPG